MATGFDLSSIIPPVDDIVRLMEKRREKLLGVRAQIDAELAKVDSQLSQMGAGVKRAKATEAGEPVAGAKRGRKGKRIRRTREQLGQTAKEIVEFITASGKTGVTGADVKDKFGRILPSVKGWLKLYAPNAKIRTEGAKARMRYFGA